MGLTLAAAFAVAAFAAVFRSEFEAWMPWLAERLRRLALRDLKGSLRDRLDEEWAAYLEEVPGYGGKVLCALGFNIAALRISLSRSSKRVTSKVAILMGGWALKCAREVGNWSIIVLTPMGDDQRVFWAARTSMKLTLRLTLGGVMITHYGICRIDDDGERAKIAKVFYPAVQELTKAIEHIRKSDGRRL